MDEASESIFRQGKIFFAGYIVFVALMVAALYLGASDLWVLAPNMGWVIVILSGFSLALAFLFSGALLFRVFGMHSSDHAMALPPNSIRSILTFLIFTILLAFIFYSVQSLTSGKDEEAYFDDPNQAKSLEEELLDKGILYSRSFVEVPKEVRDSEGVLQTVKGERIRIAFRSQAGVGESTREYMNQILIALFGITGSVMGFYFGSRSMDVFAQGQGIIQGSNSPEPKKTAEDEAPVPETDGASWTLSSSKLVLARGAGDLLSGTIEIDTSADEATRVFGASFVPSNSHDQPLDKVSLIVARSGNSLTISAPAVEPGDIAEGTQVAIYLEGEEEHAQSIDVTVAGV